MLRQSAWIFIGLFAASLFAAEPAGAPKREEKAGATTGKTPSAQPISGEPARGEKSAAPGAPAKAGDVARPPLPTVSGAKKNVVVIPVQEQVDSPLLFIIRRGLKQAIEQKADVVVLDMKMSG